MNYNDTQKYFLGDLYDISSGLSKNRDQFGSGYPFLSFKTVFNCTVLPTDLKDLAQTTFTEQEKYSILYGDVFLTRTSETANELGMSSVALKDYPRATFNGFTKRLRPKKGVMEIIDPKFMAYYLRSKDFRNQIDSISVLTTRASLNQGMIEKLTITVPNIETQKKIAAILSALDEKIAINRAINENLERQAVTLVAEYAERTPYSSAFSDIMSFDNGFAFQSSTYLSNGKYKIITIKNVQDGYIDSTGSAFIDGLPQRMKDSCILNIGDVLLSLTGNVGRVGVVCEENLLLNQRIAKIVPTDNKLLPFLYFVFRQSEIKTKLETIAKGTAQLNLSPIETLKLTIPYEESSAIQLSQLLEPLYRKIINNNQESYSFALLRDTLLPKLMSGKLDISAIML